MVSSAMKFTTTAASVHASLTRHDAVFATGSARFLHGRTSLHLSVLRKLVAGRYTLTLGTGKSRQTATVMLR
jgi:hypothetical protein